MTTPTNTLHLATPMSREAFLALPETMTKAEYLDGEAHMAPPPEPDHQFIVGNIYAILRQANQTLQGKLVLSPQDVYLGKHILQPDVFWVRAEGNCKVVEKHWEGAPVLVVEILSPSTARQDRSRKYDLYEQYGVREYWIVQPTDKTVEVYVLDQDKFQRYGAFGVGDVFQAPVLAQHKIIVDDFFQGLA
jgi:Uma2 family endonuclease